MELPTPSNQLRLLHLLLKGKHDKFRGMRQGYVYIG
jgi:hypothetical protein